MALFVSVGAGLNVTGIESPGPNVLVYGDYFVNDKSSDKCVHA